MNQQLKELTLINKARMYGNTYKVINELFLIAHKILIKELQKQGKLSNKKKYAKQNKKVGG